MWGNFAYNGELSLNGFYFVKCTILKLFGLVSLHIEEVIREVALKRGEMLYFPTVYHMSRFEKVKFSSMDGHFCSSIPYPLKQA